ncbi:ankyrin [Gonapodya prolifera JEL478]|uniref:Ankyrin n=1 Tax=Gonapodya prolifera (strain JEL478) TaxID=1344416 RepID=A0A139A5V0_GONPJ|nr:ankyrin [Gonapodya prolifera JEL478]|eukprot:KXS12180.1 ankyrin [Gonapodya prolifera JEL478]
MKHRKRRWPRPPLPLQSLPVEIIVHIAHFCTFRLAFPTKALNRSLAHIFQHHSRGIARRALHHFDKPTHALYYEAVRGCSAVVALLCPLVVVNAIFRLSERTELCAALWVACALGHCDTARVLITHGADVHLRSDQALLNAAEAGHSDVVEMLFQHGAFVNAQAGEALRRAVVDRRMDVVRVLLSWSTALDATSVDVVDTAMVRGFDKILALLLAHAGRQITWMGGPISGREGRLQRAAGRGYSDVVSALLTHVPFTSQYKSSALLYAARNEHRNIVDLFLSHGVDTRDYSVLKALIIVAGSGSLSIVEVLAHGGWIDMVLLLLNLDTAATAFDVDTDFLLVRAAEMGFTKIVVMLLDGFQTRFTAKAVYALLRAVMADQHEVVSTLLNARLRVSQRYLHDALMNSCTAALGESSGDAKIVAMLVDYGADVHAQDDLVLMNACTAGNVEAVKVLLGYGANVHTRSDEASLTVAAMKSSRVVDIVATHLAHGADVHAQDDLALRNACSKGHAEIVKMLLDHGANVHAKSDEAFGTSVSKGESSSHMEIVAMLVAHWADVRKR